MRGLNMMMVVLERGLVHVGRYSMTGWGMSQGQKSTLCDCGQMRDFGDDL
jgi:hypothetical protein